MSKIITNEQLLKRFPKIELSYDKVLHNKVYNDAYAYMLIPKGMKVYVWFTYWEDKNVCLVLSYDKEKKVLNQIYNYQCIFTSECALGTIMYGTLFDYNGIKHFTCEDIFYYKGINLNETNNNIGTNFSLFKKINIKKTFFEKKLEILKNIFKNNHISQTQIHPSYKKNIIIGIPVICNTLEEAFNIQSNLPYPVYSIQLHDNKKHKHKIGMYLVKNGFPKADAAAHANANANAHANAHANANANALAPTYVSNANANAIALANAAPTYVPNVPEKIQKKYNSSYTTLKVMATIQDDIYNLYSVVDNNKEKEKFIGIAMISTYKTSVMMNKIFRNIKENNNLDLLEESEDEEDFENIKEDKYVDLNKSVLMNCVYSKRFKKWEPHNIF